MQPEIKIAPVCTRYFWRRVRLWLRDFRYSTQLNVIGDVVMPSNMFLLRIQIGCNKYL